MKIILGMIILLVLAGCANIRHKAFNTTISGMAARFTLSDPLGGGTPTPTFFIGPVIQSTTTIPPGAKLTNTTEIDTPWDSKTIIKDTFTVDTTHSGNVKIRKHSFDYTEAKQPLCNKE